MKNMPAFQSNTALRIRFGKLPSQVKTDLGLTRERSAASMMERTFRNHDRSIGLKGLGDPRTLKALELGCATLDAAKAAVLVGVRHYDVNAVDIGVREIAGWLKEASGIDSTAIFGLWEHLFFKVDYDFIVCRKMAYALKRMNEHTMTRFIHGRATTQKPKRFYFFELSADKVENRQFFEGLSRTGFSLKEAALSPKWYSVVAQMTADPRLAKIKNETGFLRTEFFTP